MFKEGLEGKKVLEHHPTRLPKNNIKSTKSPISINFTYPLRKPIYPQIYQKITKKFTQKSETWICDTSIEIFDCLKHERDVCAVTPP